MHRLATIQTSQTTDDGRNTVPIARPLVRSANNKVSSQRYVTLWIFWYWFWYWVEQQSWELRLTYGSHVLCFTVRKVAILEVVLQWPHNVSAILASCFVCVMFSRGGRSYWSRDPRCQHGQWHRTERNWYSTTVSQEMCKRRTWNTSHREYHKMSSWHSLLYVVRMKLLMSIIRKAYGYAWRLIMSLSRIADKTTDKPIQCK